MGAALPYLVAFNKNSAMSSFLPLEANSKNLTPDVTCTNKYKLSIAQSLLK